MNMLDARSSKWCVIQTRYAYSSSLSNVRLVFIRSNASINDGPFIMCIAASSAHEIVNGRTFFCVLG